MFCLVSGVHSGQIFRISSEFGPGPIQDLKSYNLVTLQSISQPWPIEPIDFSQP